jgi:hypothetical protein
MVDPPAASVNGGGMDESARDLQAVLGEARDAVTDAIGIAARRLAPDGEPPADGAAATAWAALVGALDRLNGSGAALLGRLDFVGDRLLELLVAEARAKRPGEETGGRAVRAAGRVLATLAVSAKLRDAVGAAVGLELVPSYSAVYLYDPPGSHVRTHVDARDYEVVFHLIVEHDPPDDGSAGSALVAHLPGGPVRLRPGVGDGVTLRGRGTIHSWDRLAPGERRTLVAIGFDPRI